MDTPDIHTVVTSGLVRSKHQKGAHSVVFYLSAAHSYIKKKNFVFIFDVLMKEMPNYVTKQHSFFYCYNVTVTKACRAVTF